jgi:hypothetical protein
MNALVPTKVYVWLTYLVQTPGCSQTQLSNPRGVCGAAYEMRGHRAAHGKHTTSSLSPLALEALAFSVVLPHRPQCPVLLAVDQEFGEGPTLRVATELADPLGSLEVGKHEDVEPLGAWSGTEGIEASTESCLHRVESQEVDASVSRRLSSNRPSLAPRLTAKR